MGSSGFRVFKGSDCKDLFLGFRGLRVRVYSKETTGGEFRVYTASIRLL